jgi:dCTP diphosphatase
MESTATVSDSLTELRDQLRLFAADRNWQSFHTPKNLAAAVAVEAGELLSQFRWVTPEQSMALSLEQQAAATAEMTDLLFYLVRLADQLGVDLPTAIEQRLAANAARLPVSSGAA